VSRDDALRLLRRTPALAGLAAGSLGPLAAAGDALELPSEAAIFAQGDSPEWLYILAEGMVALTAVAPNGEGVVVDILERQEPFVLAAVLLNTPYSVGARTVRPVRLFRLEARLLRELVAADPELAQILAQEVARQYRRMVTQVADLKLRSVPQRLARYILGLLAARPPATELRLPYDKRLLAARLGTRAEHLSRAFAALRRYGVRTHGAHVSIADPAQLAAFAAVDDEMRGAAAGGSPSSID
jgi:CRP/FNR family transcriptional regulator, transcriptional activator FtrB